MQWSEIITVFAVIATNLGTVLALYFNLDRKMDEQRKETNAILDGIRQDLRDFHGKLERVDAEFKMHLLEEARKK